MDTEAYAVQRLAMKRKANALLDLCERYSVDAIPENLKLIGKFTSTPETQAGIRTQLGGLVALHEVMVLIVLRLAETGLSSVQKSDGFTRAIAGALSGFTEEMPPHLQGKFLADLIEQTLSAGAFVKEQVRKAKS